MSEQWREDHDAPDVSKELCEAVGYEVLCAAHEALKWPTGIAQTIIDLEALDGPPAKVFVQIQRKADR